MKKLLLAALLLTTPAQASDLVTGAIAMMSFQKHCGGDARMDESQKQALYILVARDRGTSVVDAILYLDQASDTYSELMGVTRDNLPFCQQMGGIMRQMK